MNSRKRPSQLASSSGTRTRSRNLLLGGMLMLWMVGLVARLYYLQVIDYVDLVRRAQRQQQHLVDVAPWRGTIFDRGMHPLAMSLPVDSIYAVPAEISDPDMVADVLAPILDLKSSEILHRFKGSKSFCWIKRKVSSEESERVRDLKLRGIYFQKEMKRFYPKGELAAHVLGAVGLDDNGLAGLEYSMNSVIKGRPGKVLVEYDAKRQSFFSSEWKGKPGKNVVLTLDENIQYITEKALSEAMEKWKAAWGVVIVQNPNTGQILALASQPTFNPNDFPQSRPYSRTDRAVGIIYEPGSTFKLVTLSGAIQEGLAHPQDVINCQMGQIVLAGHVIHDHERFGDITVEQVLVHSSDVGAIKLGLRLGPDRLYHYIRDFGFGSKTGIHLPDEVQGIVRPPSRWSGISIGEMSMGQEVGVTPLQLVTAYSAIANGGMLLQPRIVRDVFRGKTHDPLPPVPGRRVVSERTATTMRQMLAEVVRSGTGRSAQLVGYSAAGKTGTAQEIDASGRYSHSHYVASFVGFAPVSKPAVTILVVINSPVGAIYGAEVAAPVFRSIAQQTLGYLNIPQDVPSPLLQVASSAPTRLPRQTRGDRMGSIPADPGNTLAATPSLRSVSLSNFPALIKGPVTTAVNARPLLGVPNFNGQTMRRVAEECERMGFELEVDGSGLAVEQDPAPGAEAPIGTHVWVRFAR